MPRFTYRAKDQSFQMVEGVIEADSEAAALSRLGGEGVFPIAIAEVGAAVSSPLGILPRRISPRTLAYATQQLADLLGGGLPLLGALTLLAKQTEQLALQRVIESLADAVRSGGSLSSAMEAHPRVFPSLYRSMVRAGEAGGGLEQALNRLAELGEAEAELRSRLLSASAYPLFVFCFAILICLFLMAYVIPTLSMVIVESGQVLPLPTRVVLAVSALFTHWWWALGLGLVGAAWSARQWYAIPSGKAIVDRTLLGLPVFGDFVRRRETARLARNLGVMVGQGVPILQSLEVVSSNIANATLRQAIDRVRQAVLDGSSLAASLSQTKEFPVFVSNMVAVGEESGAVDAALLKVAATYERELDRTLRTLTTILEPVLLVAVGGVVMFIVLAMLLPVFQLGIGVQ